MYSMRHWAGISKYLVNGGCSCFYYYYLRGDVLRMQAYGKNDSRWSILMMIGKG